MSDPEGDPAQDWRSTVEREGELPLSVALTRAAQPGRRRDATAPEDFPARGWHDILWRVFWAIPEDRVLSMAGSVAFFALLAIFPGLSTVGRASRPR